MPDEQEISVKDKLKDLVERRGIVKGTVSRTLTFLEKFKREKLHISQLRTRLPKLQQAFRDFDEVQTSIELLDRNNDKQAKEREEFETSYYDVEAEIDRILENYTVHNNSQGETSTASDSNDRRSNNAISNVRLPTLNLPSFSGNYLEWVSFRDTYKALIHDSQLYSKTEKFHYLRSCLKIEAQKAIEAIIVSETNYEEAWRTLNKRYENKRLIAQEHVFAFLHSPVLIKNSYASVRKLLDDLTINLAALRALEQETDKWDALIVPIISSKFDFLTKRDWESGLDTEIPTVTKLIEFLEKKCLFLESLNVSEQSQLRSANLGRQHKNQNNQNTGKNRACNATVSNTIQCYMCKQAHALYHCPEFLKLTVTNRLSQVKDLKICSNCFKNNHSTDNCRARGCKTCQQKHNSLLHVTEFQPSTSSNSNSVVSFVKNNNYFQTLLSTVQILIQDNLGQWHKCKALLDVGSQVNFITEKMLRILNLNTVDVNWPISGINNAQGNALQLVKIQLKSIYGGYTNKLDCLVLPKITEDLPMCSFEYPFEIPTNINLADPEFNNTTSIDILFGAELFWKILETGQIKGTRNKPHFQETKLGWVVGGNMAINRFQNTSVCNVSLNQLSKQISKFWEIDEHPCNKTVCRLSQEETDCEVHFEETVQRDNEGRFMVSLPVKMDPSTNITGSMDVAGKRFTSLETRFKRNPSLKSEYVNFINEYEQLEHMKEVSQSDDLIVLPHHPVLKSESSTTKLRVVFDASAKSLSGFSLNDMFMNTPNIQDDLINIILRFRLHQIVFTADISKMYRQILVRLEDRKYQNIIWRENINEPIKIFQLNTVTYGMSCSPYIAVKCLKKLAVDEADKFPHAHSVLLRDFYIDDVLTGANSIEETLKIKDELILLLKAGCFELRKFASNVPELLPKSYETVDNNHILNFDKNGDTKTLGLFWNCKQDNLKYEVNVEGHTKILHTKRNILSIISKIYDPLQLIGPVIVNAKLIIQTLWRLNLGWDEKIPDELRDTWVTFLEQLSLLNEIRISRKVITIFPYVSLELHGFSDASQNAYGACVYVRAENQFGDTSVHLLCSKSRVAPLKTISIPRLELCAALLLAKLVANITEVLTIEINNIYYWTDSTIVLTWISTVACNLKTFVANRAAEIQSLSNIQNWKHVPTTDNPADIISRGMLPKELANSELWFYGPSWLKKNCNYWPNSPIHCLEIPEIRKIVLTTTVENSDSFIYKFSSIHKLKRVIAFCFRFFYNCKNKNNKSKGELTVEELRKALQIIVKIVQQREFARELSDLKNNKEINSKSKLKTLNPFVDRVGIIRVGGRLRNAKITYDQMYPVVLPKHHITNLLIRAEHELQLHAGPLATLAALRQRYWPLNGRNQVRKIIRGCMSCFKTKPTKLEPLMGNLPAPRVVVARPFINCGVDYGGPIIIKESNLRSKRTLKAYICLFVCFCTKAVHIELTTDLTTSNFLNALKRFIARRGMVQNIYSDNGTNFTGANNELKRFLNSDNLSRTLHSDLSKIGIKWHFIPARSPHFGGIWEAGIKSAKGVIKRVVGNTVLYLDEMQTLLASIEACLNSRPLCPLSSDPEDPAPLTPGHFLIGGPLTALVEEDFVDVAVNRLNRYQHLEMMKQHFWRRWSREYLNQLQPRAGRQRGTTATTPIDIGNLVVLRENTPPLTWRMGRVTEVHPGDDGIVRVVTVRTANGLTKRAVKQVCVLPNNEVL